MTTYRRPPPFTLAFTLGIGSILFGVGLFTAAWAFIIAAAAAVWVAIVCVTDDLASYIGQWAVALASVAGGMVVAAVIAVWLYGP